jgi:hypothetical protein
MSTIRITDFLSDDELDSNLKIDNPTKNDSSVYLSNVSYKGNNLIFQTPKVILESSDTDTLQIKENDELNKFFKMFDKKIINTVSKNSKDWFSQELSTSKVSQIYKSCKIHDIDTEENKYLFKLNEEIKVYGRNREPMTLTDINPDSSVILLIRINYIVFYKTTCVPYFEVLHVKVKEPKPPPIEYSFREEEEAHEEKEPIKIPLKLDELKFN